MQERYLICKNCNGYYKLQDEEEPDQFDLCSCGGDLVLVDDIEEYFQGYIIDSPKKRIISKKSSIVIFSCLLIAFMVSVNIFYTPLSLLNSHDVSNKFILGSDNTGYVTKEVYGNSLNTNAIAVVTGIHPREKLSKRVTGDVIKNYSQSSRLKIVHYDIIVTNNPENYNVGRTNGEWLAVNYILPDIKKSNFNLIIICHDHKPGYGEGFYIATPQMDEKSVKLAQLVNQSLYDFNYYRSDNAKEHSSSALKFSKPLATSGYKTFVYEIPGWESYDKAYNMTYSFLDKCSMFLT